MVPVALVISNLPLLVVLEEQIVELAQVVRQMRQTTQRTAPRLRPAAMLLPIRGVVVAVVVTAIRY